MALLADPLPPGRVPAALDRVNVAVKRSTDLLTALFRPDMPEHAALLREFFPPGSSMPAGPLSQELIAQLAVLLLPRILPLYRRIAMDYSEDLRRMAWGAYVIEFLLHIEITGKPPAHEEEATRRYNDLFHPMFVSAAVGISHLATAAPCRGRLAEDVLLLDALSVGAVSGPLFCCTLRADSLGGQDQDALAVEIQNGMAPFLNILLEHPKPWRDHSNTENYPAAAAAHEHLRALSERRGCSPALKQMARIYVQAIGSAQRWDGAGAGPDWPETYAAIRERVAASGRVADRCDACSAAAETLKRCARCRIARYCSEACLRAAWKAGHKDVCVDAKSLRQDDDEGLSSRVVELMKDMDDVTGRVVDDMLGKGEAERIGRLIAGGQHRPRSSPVLIWFLALLSCLEALEDDRS
ncbi:hypothetical protein DFJ74DRAFT_653095 [Hyaloraphidium curvatum]|nr:hypothetical protein DFJ74DRAFT_653095 [Hyaloraphidium curvatum]